MRSLNSNYKGTYATKIKINSIGIVKSLGRKRNTLDYYGHATYEMAMVKGLYKSFQIIECIETGKTLIEKKRSPIK